MATPTANDSKVSRIVIADLHFLVFAIPFPTSGKDVLNIGGRAPQVALNILTPTADSAVIDTHDRRL